MEYTAGVKPRATYVWRSVAQSFIWKMFIYSLYSNELVLYKSTKLYYELQASFLFRCATQSSE